MWEVSWLEGLGLGLAQRGARWREPECQGEDTPGRGTHGSELSAKGPPQHLYFGTRWERDGEDGKTRARCEG